MHYNLLIFSVVCVGLIAGNVAGPIAQLWIRAISIIFAPLSTILIIFVPKFILLWSGTIDSNSSLTTSNSHVGENIPMQTMTSNTSHNSSKTHSATISA